MSKRCTGHCCQRFYLPHTPAELQEKKSTISDGEYLADMVIPFIGCAQWDGYYNHYTCKHFDGRNCTAYEARPQVCRDYPYNKPCRFKGCTATEVTPAAMIAKWEQDFRDEWHRRSDPEWRDWLRSSIAAIRWWKTDSATDTHVAVPDEAYKKRTPDDPVQELLSAARLTGHNDDRAKSLP